MTRSTPSSWPSKALAVPIRSSSERIWRSASVSASSNAARRSDWMRAVVSIQVQYMPITRPSPSCSGEYENVKYVCSG
jgi:hypothetical protein